MTYRLYQGTRPLAGAIVVATFSSLLFAAGVHAQASAHSGGIGPTVKEIVEFTRLVQPDGLQQDDFHKHISPDGSRAFVVTRRGEVATDNNYFDVLLLDMNADRLSQGRPAPTTSILTIEALNDDSYTNPPIQDAKWVGRSTIVFRGRMDDGPVQAFSLDVESRKLTQLTFAAHPVVSFDVSADLKRVLYALRLPNPVMRPGARSLVVENHSFWNVMYGQNYPIAQRGRFQTFFSSTELKSKPIAVDEPFVQAWAPVVVISPTGDWALLKQNNREKQVQWAKQYPLIASGFRMFGAIDRDPTGFFSQTNDLQTRYLVAYRLNAGAAPTGRTVLDAPDDARSSRADQIWRYDSSRGESVVIAGTHLPVEVGAETIENTASHIIEYWPETQQWEIVARLSGRLGAVYSEPGDPTTIVVVDDGKRKSFRRHRSGAWLEVVPDRDRSTSPKWRLKILEGWNLPPDIQVVSDAGQSVQLTRLNPQFDAKSWGIVTAYEWKDRKGRLWKGGVIKPNNFDARKKYPLLIQTYGFVDGRFYLDGSNLVNGFTSGFPGRALMRENMVVLAVPTGPEGRAAESERELVDRFMDGVDGAISALVADGWVDRDRIGIMGWSATGNQVNRYLTFANPPIRAASILDGDSGTLFGSVITYGFSLFSLNNHESLNGGAPYGETLLEWVKNDPSMHTNCVKAALRIESYGPAVLGHWDTYTWLRRQFKAVEKVLIPQGTHSLSRPSERMISLQGNVDWYNFWLRGVERTELAIPGETREDLENQYRRWRLLSALKEKDDLKPRCPSNR